MNLQRETSVGRQLAFFILNRYVSSITQSEFALKRYSYVCIYLAFMFYLHAKISHKVSSLKHLLSSCLELNTSTWNIIPLKFWLKLNAVIIITCKLSWSCIIIIIIVKWHQNFTVLIVHERLTDKCLFCCHRASRVWTLI